MYTPISWQNVPKILTFSAFSINYTHNIQRDPLGWDLNFKVGPMPTFLPKEIERFSEKFTPTNQFLILFKSWLSQKTILTWWSKTISPLFSKFCLTFRTKWKWIETTRKTFFTQVQGGFGSIWGLFDQPKVQKLSFFKFCSEYFSTKQY